MFCQPIGMIRTPFNNLADMPVQPTAARGVNGSLEVREEFASGLVDLDGFSHLYVIYHFHRQGQIKLTVTPFLDNAQHGVFATRAPCRPNPIGISVLILKRIEGTTLLVEDVDMLDGTPLLDIKPYVPVFDQPPGEIRTGWLNSVSTPVDEARSDQRFID